MTRRLTKSQWAKLGAKGGKTKGKCKARDPEKMRAAALKRWGKAKDHEAFIGKFMVKTVHRIDMRPIK